MKHLSYYLEIGRKLHPTSLPKIFNYLKYRLLKKRSIVSARQYTPQIGALLLTMRCNLNCSYCNVARILRQNRKSWRDYEADLGKIKRIFDHPLFANCLMVDLLGGEPLLVKDLDKIVAYLTEKGHLTNVSTNGLLLTDRIADLKQAGVTRINLSLYQSNQSIIKNSLGKINKIFPVHTSLVITRRMIEKEADNILKIITHIHRSGCLSLRFWMYRPMGFKPKLDEVIKDNNSTYLEFKQKVEETIPGFCFWPAEVKTKTVKKLCPQLWQRINCDMSGNIGICCGTDEFLLEKKYNLFQNDADVVFNHPKLISLRKQLLDPKKEPPAICKKCNLLSDPGW